MTTDNPQQLGMIGLGRMGANLVRRLMRDGHRCVVYDVNADAVAELEGEGATGAAEGRGSRVADAIDVPVADLAHAWRHGLARALGQGG